MHLGVSSVVGWSATDFWVPEIVSCGSAGLGAGSWFIFCGVLDFVNGGADTVLWVLFCSFFMYFGCLLFRRDRDRHAQCSYFCFSLGSRGISGVDFLVVVLLTLPL